MSILLHILAAIRIVIVFGMMIVYILSYGIKSLFVPHTKQRALRLRKNFVTYVAIPILNIEIEIKGKPSVTPALYVANHRSFSDPIVICKFLDAFVIAKAEVANYPIINKGAELTGVVWVDRQNKDSRSATRDKLVEIFLSGYNILVFPEGTVGKDKDPLPFRKGTFIEASENNIPVIPIAIEYKSQKDLWVLEKFVPQYLYQFSKWRTYVKVTFGEPLIGSDGDQLSSQAYSWVQGEIRRMQDGWSEMF